MFNKEITNLLVVKEDKMYEVVRAAYELKTMKSGHVSSCDMFESEEGETLVEFKTQTGMNTLPVKELFEEISSILSKDCGGRKIHSYKSLEIDDYFDQHVFFVA
ncbi:MULTISPECIES: hypothetical protein [unclassified Psychrobacillus]|uniref:hypothetical protein n=1 Tax=unclassified Psychrobacillus TaxID=2636677 RepID=UPI0030F67A86